jgi:hypothetical protein
VPVTETVEVTCGALSKPEEEIVPALVLQLTAVLKLPVPLTVAEHWLVPPDVMVEGKQLTLTPVIEEDEEPPPPPPQAAIQSTLATTSNKPSLRTMLPP